MSLRKLRMDDESLRLLLTFVCGVSVGGTVFTGVSIGVIVFTVVC